MKSLLRKLALVSAVAIIATLVTAIPASAHGIVNCNDKTHDSSQIATQTNLDHTASPPKHEGAVHSGPSWDTCTGPYVATNVTDVWIATYADKLVNGSWKNCSKYVKGWRGANVGFGELWIARVQNTTWYSGDGSCRWGTYRVRSRAFGKGQFRDGHIIKVWTYNPGHATI